MFSFANRRIVSTCLASAALISTSNMDSPNRDYSKQIQLASDYIETERLIQGVPGITIAVIKNNELIWSQGFGYSDIENRVKASPLTKMRIASISKSFTSAGIGYLMKENKLNLNDYITDYITDYPLLPYKIKDEDDDKKTKLSEELCKITVEQLANHQSGIRHYKDDEFLSNKPYKNCMETLDIFKNDALNFKPGTDFGYSTYNYCILSAIIEKITNRKFIHFMENEIFEKLKMFNTIYETNNNIINNRSKQYIRKKDENDLLIESKSDEQRLPIYKRATNRLYHTPFVDNSNKFAGGGFLSTCQDIARFGNQMVFSDFLPYDIKDKLFMGIDNKYNYGIGWDVIRDSNNQIIEISHSGGAVGGCSHLLIIPKEKLVVALLMNLQGGNPYITRQVAKFFQAL